MPPPSSPVHLESGLDQDEARATGRLLERDGSLCSPSHAEFQDVSVCGDSAVAASERGPSPMASPLVPPPPIDTKAPLPPPLNLPQGPALRDIHRPSTFEEHAALDSAAKLRSQEPVDAAEAAHQRGESADNDSVSVSVSTAGSAAAAFRQLRSERLSNDVSVASEVKRRVMAEAVTEAKEGRRPSQKAQFEVFAFARSPTAGLHRQSRSASLRRKRALQKTSPRRAISEKGVSDGSDTAAIVADMCARKSSTGTKQSYNSDETGGVIVDDVSAPHDEVFFGRGRVKSVATGVGDLEGFDDDDTHQRSRQTLNAVPAFQIDLNCFVDAQELLTSASPRLRYQKTLCEGSLTKRTDLLTFMGFRWKERFVQIRLKAARMPRSMTMTTLVTLEYRAEDRPEDERKIRYLTLGSSVTVAKYSNDNIVFAVRVFDDPFDTTSHYKVMFRTDSYETAVEWIAVLRGAIRAQEEDIGM